MTRTIQIGGGVAGFLAALAALTSYGFGVVYPEPLRWAGLAALAVIFLIAWAASGCPKITHRPSLAALGCLAFASLSLLWTPDWREGSLNLHNLAAAIVVYVGLCHMDHDRLARLACFLAMVTILASLLFVAFGLDRDGLYSNPSFHAEVLIGAIPLVFLGWVVWRDWILGFWFGLFGVIAALYLIFGNTADARWLGLAGLGLGGILAFGYYRHATLCLVGVAGALGIAAATADLRLLFLSALSRFEYSWNTAMAWLDAPLMGHGVGSFNYVYPFHAGDFRHLFGDVVELPLVSVVGKAHNDPLQLLSAFGLVGAVLMGLWLWAAWKARATDWPAKAGFTSLMGLLAASLVGFPFQNPATVLIAMAALALASKPAEIGAPIKYVRAPALIATVALGIGLGSLNTKAIEASTWYVYGKRIAKLNPVETLKAMNRANGIMPLDYLYRMQPVITLAYLYGRSRIKISDQAADAVYRMARTSSPEHPGILGARAVHLLHSGRWATTGEIEWIIATLKERSPFTPETWLISGHYEQRLRRYTEARRDLERAKETKARPVDIAALKHAIEKGH